MLTLHNSTIAIARVLIYITVVTSILYLSTIVVPPVDVALLQCASTPHTCMQAAAPQLAFQKPFIEKGKFSPLSYPSLSLEKLLPSMYYW
jgi:hypothetical protein